MSTFLRSRAFQLVAGLFLMGLVCALGVITMRARPGSSRPVHHHPLPIRITDPATACGPVSLAVVTCYFGQPAPIAALREET